MRSMWVLEGEEITTAWQSLALIASSASALKSQPAREAIACAEGRCGSHTETIFAFGFARRLFAWSLPIRPAPMREMPIIDFPTARFFSEVLEQQFHVEERRL